MYKPYEGAEPPKQGKKQPKQKPFPHELGAKRVPRTPREQTSQRGGRGDRSQILFICPARGKERNETTTGTQAENSTHVERTGAEDGRGKYQNQTRGEPPAAKAGIKTPRSLAQLASQTRKEGEEANPFRNPPKLSVSLEPLEP